MTCCDHRQISHRYDPATRANSGACLVSGCGCAGGESAPIGLNQRGNGVSVWENRSTTESAPSQRELTRGDDHNPARSL